jgi:hypothetical protein
LPVGPRLMAARLSSSLPGRNCNPPRVALTSAFAAPMRGGAGIRPPCRSMYDSALHGLIFSDWPSALPACLCGKRGDILLHFCTLALRTGSFGLSMLGNTLNDGEFLFTVLAFILVCGHDPPPFPCHEFSDKNTNSVLGVFYCIGGYCQEMI